MPGFIRPFFSPLGVIITSVLGTVIAIRIIRILVLSRSSGLGRKIIFCIVGLFIVIFISFKVFMSDFNRPSKVDISPLKNLVTCDLDKAEERLGALENIEGVESFRSSEGGGVEGRKWGCSYTMHNWDIPANVSVSIGIYDYSAYSRERFNWEKENSDYRYKLVRVSKDIDVMLCRSEMTRGYDQLLAYNDSRYIVTIARVGNLVVTFRENESELTEIGALTSKNIALICEVLQG